MFKPADVQTERLPRSSSTAILLNKAGERVAVYHVSRRGQYRWQHALDERCVACPGGESR